MANSALADGHARQLLLAQSPRQERSRTDTRDVQGPGILSLCAKSARGRTREMLKACDGPSRFLENRLLRHPKELAAVLGDAPQRTSHLSSVAAYHSTRAPVSASSALAGDTRDRLMLA